MLQSRYRIFILLWLCRLVASDGFFSIRLLRYSNPNSVLSNNAPCDTFGRTSPCDMLFTVSLTVGAYSESPAYISPEYSDTVEANNIFTKTNLPFTGAIPTATDNWRLHLRVVDIDPAPAPPEFVDDLTLNNIVRQVRSSSFNGTVPADYTQDIFSSTFSRSLTWSYQVYCSENYYSSLCNLFCAPRDDPTGHYTCNSVGEKVCNPGFWDPSTNCVHTYCNPTPPCQNGGTCNPVYDRFTCDCPPNYYSTFCELVLNPCAVSNPCRNGTCSNPSRGAYSCSCFPGWTGTNCEADINECAAGVCNAAGTEKCTNLIGSFTCDCRLGWSGPTCANISDPCLALRPCQHGNCSRSNGTISGYSCACDTGWNGTNCDADIDECAAGMCQAAGTASCVNYNGSFACSCKAGWSGPLCSSIANYCMAFSPCQHGSCANGTSSNFTCACDTGWQGASCDSDIDECSLPGYCVNRVSCQNTNGSYLCNCLAGFEGARCNTRTNICTRYNPCGGRGNCSVPTTAGSGSLGYACACNSGWTGVNCTEDHNECANPAVALCEASRVCVNLPGSYRCDATVGTYWYVIFIIAIVILVAVCAIAVWRIRVWRSRNVMRPRSGGGARSQAPRGPMGNPSQDRAKSNGYGHHELGVRSPQQVGQANPGYVPSREAEYMRLESVGAGTSAAGIDLMGSGTYAEIRASGLLGTGKIPPHSLLSSGPKPRVPDAPRPSNATTAGGVQLAPHGGLTPSSEYDNCGYMALNTLVNTLATAAAPDSAPAPAASRSAADTSAVNLSLTDNPEGYMTPAAFAAAVAGNAPAAASLPPKPPKVKRKRNTPKRAPPPPPPLEPTAPPPPSDTSVDIQNGTGQGTQTQEALYASIVRMNSDDVSSPL